MSSKYKTEFFSPQINEWAETSCWLGVISLLPYIISTIVLYIQNRMDVIFFQIEFILGLLCAFWGILLGSISSITGMLAIGQIKNSQNRETGIRVAAIGIIFGFLSVVLNLVFWFTFFIGFVKD